MMRNEFIQRPLSGQHLIIDAHVKDGMILSDPGALCDLFDELVRALGMEYLQPPSACRVPLDSSKVDTDDDEGGWSVICQLTTSHIALHGWPMRCAFMLDVFSCRNFDESTAIEIIGQRLGVVRSVVTCLNRGTK